MNSIIPQKAQYIILGNKPRDKSPRISYKCDEEVLLQSSYHNLTGFSTPIHRLHQHPIPNLTNFNNSTYNNYLDNTVWINSQQFINEQFHSPKKSIRERDQHGSSISQIKNKSISPHHQIQANIYLPQQLNITNNKNSLNSSCNLRKSTSKEVLNAINTNRIVHTMVNKQQQTNQNQQETVKQKELVRKVKILQSRIFQLHRDNQLFAIKMTQQNKKLFAQSNSYRQQLNRLLSNSPQIIPIQNQKNQTQQNKLITLLRQKVLQLQSEIQRVNKIRVTKKQDNCLDKIIKLSISNHNLEKDTSLNIEYTQIQALEEQNKYLNKQLQNQKNQVNILNARINEINNQLLKQKQSMQEKDKNYKKLQNQYEQFKLSISYSKAQIQNNNKQIVNQYQILVNTLKNKIQELQSRTQKCKQNQSLYDQSQIQNNLLKINQVIQRIKTLQELNQSLQKKINFLNQQNQMQKQKNVKNDEKITFLISTIDDKVITIQQLKIQNIQVYKTLQTYKQKIQQIGQKNHLDIVQKLQSSIQTQEFKVENESTKKYKDLIKTVMKLNSHLAPKK